MEPHANFIKKRTMVFDLVRFMGGFWGSTGRTKITRSDANNIIHLFSEATKIPYADLIYSLLQVNPKYEEMFKVEQYNRNNKAGSSKIEFDWPQGA